jgi:peptidoglycan/LPS O-acetylase OafA/YrhL
VTYASNYGQIAGAEVGRLSHTWSLAVEEHFYVLWPLIIAVLRPSLRLKVVVGLLAIATSWRIWMTATGEFNRVNLGTDAVAFALLAGCVLAVLHHNDRVPAVRPQWTMLGVVGIIVAAILVPTRSQAFLWVSIPVVALSIVAVAGSLRGFRPLESRILRWFGLVSYGLYLWHVPFLWSRVPVSPIVLIAAALLITWFSYRFIELPLRRRFHRSALDELISGDRSPAAV